MRVRAVGAAAALISARGVSAATFEAVAEEADCSVHSLYAAFGGRDALLEAVYDRYIPALDFHDVVADRSADLIDTVRRVYRSLAEMYLCEPRVVSAVLAEALAHPAGAAGQVLVEHGMMRRLVNLGEWLDREVAAGRIRDVSRPLLVQQLVSPILVHCMMRSVLATVPQVALPALDECCETFADAFVRAVAP